MLEHLKGSYLVETSTGQRGTDTGKGLTQDQSQIKFPIWREWDSPEFLG